MAEHKVEIKMSRFDNAPWGFRVHGGMDFGCPLTIQKVNLRSLGEAAGLQAGDVIFSVNGQDISLLRHKEAQEAIKQAGNNFVLTVGRSDVPPVPTKPIQPQQQPLSPIQPQQQPLSPVPPQTLTPPQQWKPDVQPVGQMPKQPTQTGQTFTQTSLKANVPEDSHWDVKHNQAAKGFNASPASKVNGISNNNSSQQQPTLPPSPVVTNLNATNKGPQKLGPNLPTKQYNSPKHMYSDEAIQEIMAQQAEVLAGGVKGINFKQYEQPEKEVPANSEVLKALLEHENQEQRGVAGLPEFQENRRNQVQGFKAVSAPVSKPRPDGQAAPTGPPLNTCAQCDRLITGVFCKVQGKPLHADCFVCLTCSAPLKNVGYFSVKDKLYCEPHARAAKASENVSQRIPMNTQAQQQQPAKQQQQERAPTQQEMKEEWDRLLAQNTTGAATNAEDFTKSFMAEMFGKMAGQNQQPQQPQPQPQPQAQQQQKNVQQINTNGRAAAPKPQVQERQNQEWSQVLNQNKTGAATNAEDFTKQFMAEMFGNGAQTQQNQAPPPIAPQTVNNQNTQPQTVNYQNTQGTAQPEVVLEKEKSTTPPDAESNIITTSSRPKKVGGSFQWPPPKTDENVSASTYIAPNQQSQQTQQSQQIQQSQQTQQSQQNHQQSQQIQQSQQTQQSFQQSQQSFQQTQQVSQQTQQISQQVTQQQQVPSPMTKPVSILKQTLPQQSPAAPPQMKVNIPEIPAETSYTPGPGQNVTAPRRGRGELNEQQPGMRAPICGACDGHIRGPFITALGRTWCPSHFTCSQATCQRSLQETGFVEEKGHLYCEECYGKYLAPDCEKCRKKILGNCLKAMGKTFHPECFVCAYCGKIFANSPFYLEDGLPYCEEDWNELFTTKCVSCGFPIEAGDRWVEALNNNYHSQCFNCTLCKKNLEGKGFFVKAGKPFCKSHARMGI